LYMKKQIKTRFGYIHWGTNMSVVVILFVIFIGILVFLPIWNETSTSDLSEYAQDAINDTLTDDEEELQTTINGFYEHSNYLLDIIGVVLAISVIMVVVSVVYSFLRW